MKLPHALQKKWRIGWMMAVVLILVLAGTALADRNGIVQLTGDVTVVEGEVINGDIQALAGNITVKGTVNGNVVATAGTVQIYGKVNGNVQALAGNIYVRNEGEISGDATAMAGNIHKDDSATIGGSIIEMAGGNGTHGVRIDSFDDFWINPLLTWGMVLWGVVTGLISWLAIGALLMLFFTKQIVFVGEAIQQRKMYYFLVGFASYILVPVVFILLLITLIGIPVAFVLIPVVMVATIFGQLGIARMLGQWLIERFGWNWNTEMARVLLGAAVIFVITLIPVIGWLFFFATACMGIGGVVINRFGTQKKEV